MKLSRYAYINLSLNGRKSLPDFVPLDKDVMILPQFGG
jgi:hypothetical protein